MWQIVYILFGLHREHQQNKRLKTVVVCTQCATELSDRAKFCPKCGSGSLLAAGDFDRFKRKEAVEEIKDLEQRSKRNEAIARIRALAGYTFCIRCDVFFDEKPAFCPLCGADITKQFMPEQSMVEVLRKEYPNHVKTRQDYNALRLSSPEPGIEKRLASLHWAKLKDVLTGADKTKPTYFGLSETAWVVTLVVTVGVAVLFVLAEGGAFQSHGKVEYSQPVAPTESPPPKDEVLPHSAATRNLPPASESEPEVKPVRNENKEIPPEPPSSQKPIAPAPEPVKKTVVFEPNTKVGDLTISGKKYTGVTVTKIEPSGISIRHEDGTARILFTDLPEDLQKKFGYDPTAAK